MADKLMYIANDDTQNYPLCRLQLVVETFGHSDKEPTNQNLIKVPRLLGKQIRKRYNKTLETRVIDSLMSTPSQYSNTISCTVKTSYPFQTDGRTDPNHRKLRF